MRNIETVGTLGHGEGTRSLSPFKQLLDVMFPIGPDFDSVFDDSTVAVSITDKEAVGVFTDGNRSRFAIVTIVSSGNKLFPQHDLGLVIASVRSELENLVKSHVRQPDVVLGVHGDHVGEEEHVPAPGVHDVPRGVDGEDGVLGDGNVLIQTVSIISVNKIFQYERSGKEMFSKYLPRC